MKTLFELWLLKTKGKIRKLFKSKSSGIFTILMILGYGFIGIGFLANISNQTLISNSIDFHTSIIILIGFLALMLFSTLLQSRKALFFGEDAFYLFTGPFTKKQIMSYLTFQTIIQSFMLALITQFMFMAFSGGIKYSWGFVILAYLLSVIACFTFLILTDYLYVLSIGDDKYRKYSKIIPVTILGFVIIIILILFIQTGNYKTLFYDFIQSDLFYIIPVFGWIKLVLIAYVEYNYLHLVGGLVLLVGLLVLVYTLFISYKGDFYEQALQDSLELSKRLKEVQAGKKNTLNDVKVKKDISGTFRGGAYAIMSKNILLMKKTNNFISMIDLITIGIYMAITLITGFGLGMFVYMMIIWMFTSLQNSDLARELKNYQVYLIPDNPFKKLIATIIPTFIKIFIVTTVSFVLMGIYYQANIMTVLTYLINIISYTIIFISGSVLSIKIFKTNSSVMFENFMRMLVVFIGAIPSSVVLTIVTINYEGEIALMIGSYLVLVINLLIGFIVLYSCSGMMNGRELSSE